jgi:hypothetical protein
MLTASSLGGSPVTVASRDKSASENFKKNFSSLSIFTRERASNLLGREEARSQKRAEWGTFAGWDRPSCYPHRPRQRGHRQPDAVWQDHGQIRTPPISEAKEARIYSLGCYAD